MAVIQRGDTDFASFINVVIGSQILFDNWEIEENNVTTAFEINNDGTNAISIEDSTQYTKITSGRLRLASDTCYIDGLSNTLTFFTSGSERVRITSTGNVGIGKTPTKTLDISGNVETDANLTCATLNANGAAIVGEGSGLFIREADTTSEGAQITMRMSDSLTNWVVDLQGADTANQDMRVFGGGTGDLLLVSNSSGNVGIGAASSSYKLDVNGDVNARSGFVYRIDGNDVLNATTLGSGVVNSSLTNLGTLTGLTMGGDLHMNSNTDITFAGGIGSGRISCNDGNSGDIRMYSSGGVMLLNLDNGGNVGIKKNEPNYDLDVDGDINVGNTHSYRASNNVVLSATTLGSGVVNSSLTSVGTLTGLTMGGDLTMNNTTNIRFAGGLGNARIIGNDGNTGDLRMYNASDVMLLNIDNDGYVGIKNSLPAYDLDVTGNTNISGSYKISGTDVLTSTTLGSGVVNSSLTNVGTLSGLTMSGDLDMGTNNIINATNLTGTLQTAAQPNVTSLGTLTSLDISGNLTVDTDTLYVSSSTNRVGINKIPLYDLDITSSGDSEIRQSCGNTTGTSIFSLFNSVSSGLQIEYNGTDNKTYLKPFNSNSTITAERLIIDDNGYLGIQNKTPSYPLDVDGDINTDTGHVYRINGADVLNATTLGSSVVNSSLTSVGILNNLTTGSNLTILEQDGSTEGGQMLLRMSDGSSNFVIDLQGADTSNQNMRIFSASSGDILLGSNGNANVAISAATALYKFDVNGDINARSGFAYKINGTDVLTSTTVYLQGANTFIQNNGAGKMDFYTNNTIAMDITTGGDVRIINDLEVENGTIGVGTNPNADNAIIIRKDSTVTTPAILIRPDADASRSSYFEIRGARSASTNTEASTIILSNYDDDILTTKTLGHIEGIVSNATTNVGDLRIMTSSDGSTMTECARFIGSTNNVDFAGAISAAGTAEGINSIGSILMDDKSLTLGSTFATTSDTIDINVNQSDKQYIKMYFRGVLTSNGGAPRINISFNDASGLISDTNSHFYSLRAYSGTSISVGRSTSGILLESSGTITNGQAFNFHGEITIMNDGTNTGTTWFGQFQLHSDDGTTVLQSGHTTGGLTSSATVTTTVETISLSMTNTTSGTLKARVFRTY